MRLHPALLLVVLTLVRVTAADLPSIPPPLKAPDDKTEYRRLVLDNGLRVLLVTDPKCTISSVALAVDAGSFDEPSSRPGLGHYLEHLLLLGSDRYPDPGEFTQYIGANGGSRNGHTTSDHTTFLFEIPNAGLEGALDRFARFFIAPRFDPDFCDREVTAIQNEFERHRDNDTMRFARVCAEMYDASAPDARFSIGNRATLEGTPREEVIEFYTTHYSADRMALVLCSSADLDRLEGFARRYFNEIPRRSAAPRNTDSVPFLSPKAALRTVHITSVDENPILFLQFPVGPTRADFTAKPADLVTALFGNTGKGSLQSQLKAEGLALAVGALPDDRAADHGAFNIRIVLTADGLAQTDRVLALVFAYTRMLQSEPFPLALFKERAAFAQREEAYGERAEGDARIAELALACLHYPLELAERIPFLWITPDNAAYRRVLSSLRPENCLVAVLAPGIPTDRQEKYYGFQYSYSEQTGAAFDTLGQPLPDTVFHLPPANPFAEANTVVLDTCPIRIVDEPGLTMTYAQERDLARPQVSYRFQLRPGTATLDERATAQLACFQLILNLALRDLGTDARAAGIQYGITFGAGLGIRTSGFSGSTEHFLAELVDRVATVEIDEQTFEAARGYLLNAAESSIRAEAHENALSRLEVLKEIPGFTLSDLIPAIRALTRDEVANTLSALFASAQLDGFACGNVDPAEAARLARHFRDRLHYSPAACEQTVRTRYLQLSAGETIVDAITVEGENSFTGLDLTAPEQTPEYRAAAGLIGNFINSDFHNDLRTQQQLGYVVGAGASVSGRMVRIYGVVQSSEYPSDELRRRIEAYFADLGRRWAALSPEQFATLREGLRAQLADRPKNAAERCERFFDLAYDCGGDWQQTSATLTALDRLTQERVREIVAEFTDPATRRLVIEQLTSKSHTLKEPPIPAFTDREEWKRNRIYR